MTINQEALEDYISSMSQTTEIELEPTETEQLRADIDYIAAMTGVVL